MSESVYVIDAHAVLVIPELCKDSNDLPRVLDCLTEFVRDQTLTFPDQVIHDCAKIATGEQIHTWVKAVAGHRRMRKVPSQWQERVLEVCEELVDFDDDQEQGPVLVAAMALMLRDHDSGPQSLVPHIATEDRLPLPTRMCLLEACDTLGLETVTSRDLLTAAGAASYLTPN
jgi:hypothetical protein